VWRGLTQLPSLITGCFDQLRTISYLLQQSLLLQQETNLLLRELIVKVTTQAVETAPATRLTMPSLTAASLPAPAAGAPLSQPSAAAAKSRILTERDIIRNSRSSIAKDQFDAKGKVLYPHRQEEILPSSTSTRPLGPLP